MFSENVLQDYVVVITGGGSGLGQMFAKAFVQAGARVYISGRRRETLESTADMLNAIQAGSARYVVADNTRKEDLANLVRFVSDHEDRVDVLVNNAGTAIFDQPTPETDVNAGMEPNPFPVIKSDDPEAWGKQFAMFTWAPYSLTVDFIPLLAKAAKLGKGRGSVIMISSIAARFWNPYIALPGYSAAKAGLDHASMILAAKLHPWGIRINTISPGSFATDSNIPTNAAAMAHPSNDHRIPLQRSGTADDITPLAIFFASPGAQYITGQRMEVDGGLMLVANGTNRITPP
ncbi:hypothetical protein FB45DRAFT_927396 [Roridomyces roridus]|uniref:Uncharacterized protein n=1 Tax=Roridomyces roridus TaxID=1738132 RepID=A0AAD7FIG3_9AGAR|nr:hypothetical protein FB45DRAFT_927396 [Roridomyces roridus]